MQRMKFRVVGMLLAWQAGGSAWGGLVLSNASNDETDPQLLDATLSFEVTGSTLELSVRNDTPEIGGYLINEVYFNGSEEIIGLALGKSTPGWVLILDEHVGGFGIFDFGLQVGSRRNRAVISPGETVVFTLDIRGTGAFSADDFLFDGDGDGIWDGEFSDPIGGEQAAIAAAKFVGGPADDSAFGGIIIPEPKTALLVVFGAACMAAVGPASRKRRAFKWAD